MEIKQPFFVDPKQPGYVRGGPFDEMGGMLVGLHAGPVCKMLNEHLALSSEVSTFRMAIETAMDLYTEDYDDATTARLMYDALGMVLVSEEQKPLGQGLSEGLKELYGDEYEKLRPKGVK